MNIIFNVQVLVDKKYLVSW